MLRAILYQKKGERREEGGMEERRDRQASKVPGVRG